MKKLYTDRNIGEGGIITTSIGYTTNSHKTTISYRVVSGPIYRSRWRGQKWLSYLANRDEDTILEEKITYVPPRSYDHPEGDSGGTLTSHVNESHKRLVNKAIRLVKEKQGIGYEHLYS